MFDPKTRILIVDDFASMRKVTIQILTELGYSDFVEAADGKIAWNAIFNIKPSIQLVICDWNMPNATGIELLQKLRATERFEHLPFILSTTKGEKDSVLKAVECGADNYIVKPFTLEVFRQKLTSVYQSVQKKKASGT